MTCRAKRLKNSVYHVLIHISFPGNVHRDSLSLSANGEYINNNIVNNNSSLTLIAPPALIYELSMDLSNRYHCISDL